MENNEIIPGFDEKNPELDKSWIVPEQIIWNPLKTKLEIFDLYPNTLKIIIEGELEAFNASYLANKVINVIGERFRNIWIDFKNITLGDYREGLIRGVGKKVCEINGIFILQNPTQALKDYWSFNFYLPLENFFSVVITSSDADSFEHLKQHQLESMNVKKVNFPYKSECPYCKTKILFKKISRCRCPKCRANVSINEYGKIYLG